jgi:hypothetical protein
MRLTGTEFESIVVPFFKTIFKEAGFLVLDVRNQKSGTQNGFDIKITFNDLSSTERHLFVECKYYSTPLKWDEIFRKQLELFDSNQSIDGFVLLSPKRDLSNIDENLQHKVTNDVFKFPCEFWTPLHDVKNFFALDVQLFEKVYGSAPPSAIDRNEEIAKFSARINNIIDKKIKLNNHLPKKNKYPPTTNYIKRKIVRHAEFSPHRILNSFNSINLLEILKTENKIALLGGAGTGKSVELKMLASELSKDESPYYPFLIQLDLHTDKPIKEYIDSISNIPQPALVVLLDGLDDVIPKDFEYVRRRIIAFSKEYSQAKVIVSCRSNFYTTISDNNELNTLDGFNSIILSDLSSEDIQGYLNLTLPTEKTLFLKQINANNLFSLLYIPYYLIKLTEQYSKHKKIANDKISLFEEMISESIQNDVAKYLPEKRKIIEPEIRKMLEKLAFTLEYQGKNTFLWEELQAIFNQHELEIVKYMSSLLIGDDNTKAVWKFNHNNIQEYLSASIVSLLPRKEIRKIIALPPSYVKLKSSWANTTSFIISIVNNNNSIKDSLLKWLIDYNPEIVIKLEPDKLNASLRQSIFKQIFDKYKIKDAQLNHAKYNYSELTKFAISEENLKFLCDELDSNNPLNSRLTVINLLYFYDVESEFILHKEKVKQLLTEAIFSLQKEFHYPGLHTYFKIFKLSKIEFDEILAHFKLNDDSWVKYILYQSIHTQDFQDVYISFVIEQITALLEQGEYSQDRLSNESSELANCIIWAKSVESISAILTFIDNNYSRISHSSYFNKIIGRVITTVSEKLTDNTDLYKKIENIFIVNDAISYDENLPYFLKYFEDSNTSFLVFKEIYKRNGVSTFTQIQQLAIIANIESINFFVEEFKNKLISINDITAFQYCLGNHNRKYLTLFNQLANEVEPVPLKEQEDWDKKIQERKDKWCSLLFDKSMFLSAIEQVFIDEGKDTLTYKEVWEIQKTSHDAKYLPIIYDQIRVFDERESIDKNELLNYIENNWADYSIAKIIKFMKHHKDYIFNKEQIVIIVNWCDLKVKTINFETALTSTVESTSADPNAIRLSFLIRKLNLIKYDESLYLSLLSFRKWNDNEKDIFEFVEEVVAKDNLIKKVINNISNNIADDIVLGEHLKFCSKNKLFQVKDLLLPYLSHQSYTRRVNIIELYIELDGDTDKLFPFLYSFTDKHLKSFLIKKLIDKKNKHILGYLLSEFKKASTSEEKLEISKFLIQLQNIKGLRFYISFVKDKKYVPDYSSFENIFQKLNVLSALPFILGFYSLGYDKTIKQDNFINIKDICATAIHSISLHRDNFKISKFIFGCYSYLLKLKAWFGLVKKPTEILNNLNFQFENIEQQYYVRKSIDITLEEALNKYMSIKNLQN